MLLASIAGSLFAVAASAESAVRHLTVALPAELAPRTIGFYLAQQSGAFAERGLDVDFVTAGDKPPAQLLAEGKADLAVDIMPTALRLRQDGADIQHVAQFFQHAGLALYCRPPIRKPADLHGTSVGIWFDNQESAFYAWMSQLNISTFGEEDGVTIVRQKSDAQSLADRRFDCVTSTSYLLPQQAKSAKVAVKDLTAFRYEEIGLATLEDGLYARARDLKDKARLDLFARFLAGAVQGWRKAHDDRPAALHLLTAQPARTGADTARVDAAKIDATALIDSLAAVDALVDAARRPIGRLDSGAYDQTVNVLLTGAPEPVLTKAPANAVSKAVWTALRDSD